MVPVPPNYVLATLIWISFMIASCRNFYGQPLRSQLEFNDTSSLLACRFPAALSCSLATSGVTSDLPRLVHFSLMRSWKSSEDLPSWLARRLTTENKHKSAKDEIKSFVHYESVTNDLHISAQCTQKKYSQQTVFTFVGIIIYNSESFLIRPQSMLPVTSSRPIEVLLEKLGDGPRLSDKSTRPEFESQRHLNHALRHRRSVQDLTTFTVDLLVVVDNSVYAKWLSRAIQTSDGEEPTKLKDEIRNYYNHVIDGVDARYRSIQFSDFAIRVKLVDVIIMEQNILHPGSSNDDQINADDSLRAFRKWTNESLELPNFDHAILFVGYDLYTNTSTENDTVSHTSGLAYIGTMCQPGDSVSVVEEQGGFQSIGTAAHELGHSLGALHDGEGNPCRSEDRYIMAASGFGPVPAEKRQNPWRFSTCSVEYFRSFIASHLTDGTLCLDTERPRPANSLSDGSRKNNSYNNNSILINNNNNNNSNNKNNSIGSYSHEDDLELPGQRYHPDDQCRLIWGPESYLCRGSEFGDPSALCTAMYCRDPATVNDCVLHTAARGTSCGNKQWCMNGKCEYSARAPSKHSDCILGDQPGKAFNGLSCEELVDRRPSYCYQEKVRARCCQACGRRVRPYKGCEFGDRIKGCRPWHCSHTTPSQSRSGPGSGSILSDCCGTCNTGEKTLTTQASVGHQDDSASETVTQSIQAPGCHDAGHVHGVTCGEYVKMHGAYICYLEESWGKQCCATCSEIRTNNQGCEFGDRTPMLCAKMANLTEVRCSTFGHQCCESCVEEEDQAATAGASISGSDFLFIMAAVVLIGSFL